MQITKSVVPLGMAMALLSVAAPGAAADASARPAAKAAPNSPQGDSWASIAKLPDWGGAWELEWNSFNGSSATGEKPPQLTPQAAQRLAAFQAAQKRGETLQATTANCIPPGMPAIMAQPFPVEFLFTPGKVTVVIEAYGQTRRIFTDGRPQATDPDPTYQGHSTGRWEGDTLVVDTVGVLPQPNIAPGVENSDALRIEERIRLVQPDKLEIRTTLRDPKVLTEPLQLVRTYQRHRDWDIKEYVCVQNNRDGADAHGRGVVDLKR